jgi:hypothetical protein
VEGCESVGLPANIATSNGRPTQGAFALNAAVGEWKKMSESLSDSPKTEYPIVQITWADAHCGDPGWLDLSTVEDDGECLVTSVGYLIPVGEGGKEKHVTLYQTYTEGEGIHPFHIPVGMVRETKLLT